MIKSLNSSRIRTINRRPPHYSKRVGHDVPGGVAVLCESIARPHQLIAAKKKKTQPAQSNKRKKGKKN